ncbi:MAG: membrane protein insertase YidC [Rubrobacter sp.]|nr:membrane protein insertase YidC [Rubrobacter sp.]
MIDFIENLFSPITNVLGTVLLFFYEQGLPWWVAIALLTVVVRSILFPLTVKQVRSMRAMQELKPALDEIKAQYPDDRQRQQQEQMKLYQERGINPLGGCLPLLVQLPIFIGIFYVIRDFGGSVGMIGVPDTQGSQPTFEEGGILWFTNLSQSDPYFLLPVISALTMLASMEITNKSMEPQMRWIMRIMPFVFIFFILVFPAGLLVYIITTNIVTLVQNYAIYNFGPGKKTPETAEDEKTSTEEPLESQEQLEASENGHGSGSGERNGSSGKNRKAANRRKRKKRKK